MCVCVRVFVLVLVRCVVATAMLGVKLVLHFDKPHVVVMVDTMVVSGEKRKCDQDNLRWLKYLLFSLIGHCDFVNTKMDTTRDYRGEWRNRQTMTQINYGNEKEINQLYYSKR